MEAFTVKCFHLELQTGAVRIVGG